MSISVVTPSFRQFEWLKRCARSVADQGVAVEHIIQDAGTGPEVEAWVRRHTNSRVFVEKDDGMYDALNRGFGRATGEILAWLNCDEQYLPGALAAVQAQFESDPELDVLLADNLIVNPEGEYLAHRISLRPTLNQLWVRFPVASCALFFRRRVWAPFDTRWKSAGDWWWFREILLRNAKIEILRQFTSTFTETDSNLGLAMVSRGEQRAILDLRPWWARTFRGLLIGWHRFRMWQSGAYGVQPFRYAIYVGDDDRRTEFTVARPTGLWVRRPIAAPDGE